MKKVSEVFIRKDRAGYWIRWQENGQRKFKQFNSKKEADHYRHIKYMQLNNDVYTSIDIPFQQAKDEYLEKYDLRGYTKKTKAEVAAVLEMFYNTHRPVSTKKITQKACDEYVLERKKQDITPWTVNKDITCLKAFFNWLKTQGYHQGGLKLYKLPTDPPKSKALTDTQIKALIKACPTPEWRLRVVLALSTGLRKIDLYRLPTGDIDFDNNWIGTTEGKTRKYYSGPLSDDLMPYLTKHHKALLAARPFFFKIHNHQWLDKQFRSFRPDERVTIQSLRKTFSTRIEATGISTLMLNHSSTSVTRQFYNDQDFIKHIRVNQLPIKAWLA
jgi:integrase